MPKSKSYHKRSAPTTEVALNVRASSKHQFVAFVRSTGQDEQGRHVTANGIKWKVA